MKEALKRALDALESSDKLINGTGNHFGLEGAMDGYYSGCFDVEGNNKLLNEAITTIKAALAQPAQEPEIHSRWQETIAGIPVIFESKSEANRFMEYHLANAGKPIEQPSQRTWVGLDEKDFSAINQSCLTKLQAATSAESVLKEKNSGLL